MSVFNIMIWFLWASPQYFTRSPLLCQVPKAKKGEIL